MKGTSGGREGGGHGWNGLSGPCSQNILRGRRRGGLWKGLNMGVANPAVWGRPHIIEVLRGEQWGQRKGGGLKTPVERRKSCPVRKNRNEKSKGGSGEQGGRDAAIRRRGVNPKISRPRNIVFGGKVVISERVVQRMAEKLRKGGGGGKTNPGKTQIPKFGFGVNRED